MFGRSTIRGRTDQLQQEVLRVAAELVREFGDEGLDREGMRDVVDRAEPADAHVRSRLAALACACSGRRTACRPSPCRARWTAGCFGSGMKFANEARRRAAMTPGDDLVVRVEPGLEPLDRHGVVEAVLDVVLARPHHLHRRAVHRLATAAPPRSRSRISTCGRSRRRAACLCTVTSSASRPSALGDVLARAARGSAPAPTPRICRRPCAAVATGGSIVACARCGT